jgi:Zn-dependent M28 family amino/carboxypeptidase
MDHLGITSGIVYNGADDNASGTATTMEVARLMATNKIRPKRTIIFGLWCGEEEGLLGSAYWAQHPTIGASLDRVVANFNMDMVGLGDKIGAPGALNFPAVYDVILRDQLPRSSSAVRATRPGA